MIPTQRIGPFEIVSLLGRGGMGEVFLATDTRLDRKVAIKVLPDSFAHDKERLARFAREAQVLASLNHSNIAAIYGLEESGYTRALILELVEGETLAERLRRGPMPVDEALEVALQIAQALEAAHDKGIIHRDLKPANVKFTADGKVKVLDFGLAKLLEEGSGRAPQGVLEDSPTITADYTAPGTILGTAAYMSPEQAKGKSLDKRTDIWSFGCVLFECLTGQRVFAGETATDSIGAVLHKDPDWAALPKDLPPTIQLLLRKCLAKDRKRRLHDIADARVDLQSAVESPDTSTLIMATAAVQGTNRKEPWRVGLAVLPWVVAVTTTAAFFSVLLPRIKVASANRPLLQTYTLDLASDAPLATASPSGSSIVIAPDCSKVVYVGRKDGEFGLYWKQINDAEFKMIPGSGKAFPSPAFAPRSDRLVFFTATGDIYLFSFQGGLPRRIAQAGTIGHPRWAADDRIVFTTKDGIFTVEAKEGSTPTLVLPSDKSRGELAIMHSQLMPGAKSMIFTVWHTNDTVWLEGFDLTTKRRKQLNLSGSWNPVYYPVTGHLLYGRDDVLWARSFDPANLEFTGPEISLLNDVGRDWAEKSHQFSIADNGTLIYARGHQLEPRYQLVWVGDRGSPEIVPLPAGDYSFPRLAPDGRSAVLTRRTRSAHQTLLVNLVDGQATELPEGRIPNTFAFAYDGSNVFFNRFLSSERLVLRTRADGAGQPEEICRIKSDDAAVQAISADGDLLAIVQGLFDGAADILLKDLKSSEDAGPWADSPASETGPRFSPDGQWIAYTADAGHRHECYVRRVHADGLPIRISTNGGIHPIWSRDGSRLYYSTYANEIMTVKVKSREPLTFETPVVFATGRFRYTGLGPGPGYDVFTENRDRLLMLKSVYDEPEPQGATQVTVLVNFDEYIRQKTSGKSLDTERK